MNELVVPTQLDVSFSASSTELDVARAVHSLKRSAGAVLVNLTFDPGWKSLSAQFESQAIREVSDFRYVDNVMERNPSIINVSSTKDFVSLMHVLAQEEPKLLDNVFVGFNGDVRKWDNFIIDSEEKMIRLFKHMKDRSSFISDIGNRSRLSDFPRFFWFDPEALDVKSPQLSLRIQSHPLAERTRAELHGNPRSVEQDSKFLIGLKAHSLWATQSLREQINLGGAFGVIAAPYFARALDVKMAEDEIFDTKMSTISKRANVDINVDRGEQMAPVPQQQTLDLDGFF